LQNKSQILHTIFDLLFRFYPIGDENQFLSVFSYMVDFGQISKFWLVQSPFFLLWSTRKEKAKFVYANFSLLARNGL